MPDRKETEKDLPTGKNRNLAKAPFSIGLRGAGATFFLGLTVIWCALAAGLPQARGERFSPSAREVLRTCGCNREDLNRFLQAYPVGSEKSFAARFVVENLPLYDGLSLGVSRMKENLEYAFLARKVMPWGRRVPWEIFLHFVLPHRISQEPPEPWRRSLFEELAPLVGKYARIDRAALEINRWCLSQVQYRPTSARDLGPLSLLRRGWGRCEEQNILFIAAARSVGIPARQCYTPLWRHADGNHAWVEVWVDGKWRYLDTGMPRDSLDRAWFDPFVRTLAMGIVPVYGGYLPEKGKVLLSGPGYTLLNETRSYAPTETLEVRALGAGGRPLPGAEVTMSIFNGGSLRPLVSLQSDEQGLCRVDLGLGSYLVSTAWRGACDFQTVSLMAGRPVGLVADLGHPTPLAREYRMEPGPESGTAGVGPGSGRSPEEKTLKEERARLSRTHEERLKRYRTVVSRFFDDVKGEGDLQASAGLINAINDSGSRCFRFLTLLDSAPGALGPSLRQAIETMDPKDLVECVPEALPDQVALADAARQEALAIGVKYDEAMYQRYVLNNRICLEPWTDWRKEVARRFSRLRGLGLARVASEIKRYVQGLEAVAHNPLSPMLAPGLILEAGRVTTDHERGVMAVAAFRSLGIPARYRPGWKGVEVYSGAEWLDLLNTGPEGVARGHEARGGDILINLCTPGRGSLDGGPAYGREFTLNRLSPKGCFEPLHSVSLSRDRTGRNWRFSGIPRGQYFLIAGRRGRQGSARVRISPISCDTRETRVSIEYPWDDGP